MKIIYVIVYDNCGNGNDEYKLIRAYTRKDKANADAKKLNNLHRIMCKSDIWLSKGGNYEVLAIDWIA